MDDRRRVALILGTLIGGLVLGLPFVASTTSCGRQPTPPPSPWILDLCRRAEALDPGDPAHAAVFAEVLQHGVRLCSEPAAERAHALPLLRFLADYVVAKGARGRDVSQEAATLHRCYAAIDATPSTNEWQQVDFRMWGECCLIAGDLQQCAHVVRRGTTEVPQENAFEAASTQVLAGRMHLLLGRLESAAWALDAAQLAAKRYVDSLPEEHRSAADPLRLAIALLLADLRLLGDDLAGAAAALEPVQQIGDAAVYLQLCSVLRGDRSAEDALLATVGKGDTNPTLHTLVLAKLTQAALLANDLAAARRHLTGLQKRAPIASARQDGRTAALALELALREGTPLAARMRADVEQAWQATLAQWQKAPHLRGGIGLLHIGDRATLLANLLRTDAAGDAGGAETAWARLVAAHAASTHTAVATDARKVRDELTAADHGLIAFVPGRFGTAVLCLDRDTSEVHSLAGSRSLRDRADGLRAAAHRALHADPESLPAAQRALADAARETTRELLPAPIQARLTRWRRLTVVGAGSLQNVPFELLTMRVGDQEVRLGLHLAIDYVANVASAAAAPARRPLGHPVVMAASVDTTAHGPRRRMPDHAAGIVRPYTPAARVFLDDHVHVPELLADLRTAPIVHCIGHGEIDWQRPFEHAIRFRDGAGGLLTGEQVVDLDLRGVVVILGSCRAAEAPHRRGGDPLAASLAGAMASAGARCVILPTTDVQVGRHLAASGFLHAELARGNAPADALLAARNAVAAGGDATATLELLLMQLHGRGF